MAQRAKQTGSAGDGDGDQFSDVETIQRLDHALQKSLAMTKRTQKPRMRKLRSSDTQAIAPGARKALKQE
jgi:hypothetical protein